MYIMDLYMYMYKSMVIVLVDFFGHFVKIIPSQYFILFWFGKKSPKFSTITYNMKRCLIFYNFIF
jgi:hypothetical protein